MHVGLYCVSLRYNVEGGGRIKLENIWGYLKPIINERI
ncbi:hypothetical protein COPEUT_00977 [Coprococcus eutactus ATCC 27759]|nr:hypothetical protein COPEUT_00977 [Coprococcus eutactus ATCC 27759]